MKINTVLKKASSVQIWNVLLEWQLNPEHSLTVTIEIRKVLSE